MTTGRRNDTEWHDDQTLNALIDGELNQQQVDDVMRWLHADPDSKARFEALDRQTALLREIGDTFEPEDDGFAADLQAAVARRVKHQNTWRTCTRGLAAASVGGLAVLLGYAGVVNMVDRGSVDARTDAVSPPVYQPQFTFGGGFIGPKNLVEVAESEASLAWLAQHVPGVALSVPNLAELGLSLVNGGPLPQSAAPAVRLVYGDSDGNHLVLYMGAAGSDTEQAFTLMPEGLLSLHWRQGQLVFAIVGSVDSPKLFDAMRVVADGAMSEPVQDLAPNLELSPMQEATADTPFKSLGIDPGSAATAVAAGSSGAEAGLSGESTAPVPSIDPDAGSVSSPVIETTSKPL